MMMTREEAIEAFRRLAASMSIRIMPGDCRQELAKLPDESVQMVCTSPPYFGLRNYGMDGQIGAEDTPEAYTAALVEVFQSVRRVLRKDGVLWLNLGDSFHNVRTHMNGGAPTNTVHRGGARDGTECFARANRNKKLPGLKDKDLIGVPWRVAFALQADGWWLRSATVWHKPNPMPEKKSLDRPLRAYEMMFLFTRNGQYFYDRENALPDVWTIPTQAGGAGVHFATMPPELAERCIRASSRPGDTVLDPFGGAGTTALVADRMNRHAVLIELNPRYVELTHNRVQNDAPFFVEILAA
jgi:DNA modification methylase